MSAVGDQCVQYIQITMSEKIVETNLIMGIGQSYRRKNKVDESFQIKLANNFGGKKLGRQNEGRNVPLH